MAAPDQKALNKSRQLLPWAPKDPIREALIETQALLAAMLHEPRTKDEIKRQMAANRKALTRYA